MAIRPASPTERSAAGCTRISPPVLAIVAIAAIAGCDTRVGADPAQAFLLDRLGADMEEAAKAKDAGADVSFPCHSIVATIPAFKNAGERTTQQIKNAKIICRDGALVFSRSRLARLEAAKKPHESPIEECFDLQHSLDVLIALDPTDVEIQPLANKRKALCP